MALPIAKQLAEPWTSDKLAATMSTETMADIRQHFKVLNSAVQARVLMSFLSVRKNQMDQMKDSMCALLQDGAEHGDGWTKVVADLMATLPEKGSLQLDTGSTDSVLQTMAQKFAQHADELSSNDELPVLPNSMYLGRHFNTMPPDTAHGHFRLREEAVATQAEEEQLVSKKRPVIDKPETIGSPAPQTLRTTHETSPANTAATRGQQPAARRGEALGASVSRRENPEGFGLRRMENFEAEQTGKRSRGMAAVDFDDAMNESKRPRRDENAEKKKQERENLKEQKRLEREEKKKKKEKEEQERKRLMEARLQAKAAQAKKQADSGISPPEIPGIRRLPPAPAPMASSIASALAGPTNALTPANREIIARFLGGERAAAKAVSEGDVHEVVLNEQIKYAPDQKSPMHNERIIFEMNSASGKWRKLRRKLPVVGSDAAADQGLRQPL